MPSLKVNAAVFFALANHSSLAYPLIICCSRPPGTLSSPAGSPLSKHAHQSAHQCGAATDGISYIGRALAILPLEVKAREKFLPTHLSPTELRRGLTVQVGIWLVVSNHHHLLGTLQMAPPLPQRTNHSQQFLLTTAIVSLSRELNL